MPKNDNANAIRLFESIKKNVDEDTAEKITSKIALSKSADIDKRFLWAEKICEDLEKEFDDETVKQIRMDCACGPEMGKINNLKKLYQKSENLLDFTNRANSLNQGFTITYDNNVLLLTYPECYCSCVKRIKKPLSKTWCYCTLGYTKRMFSEVLDKEVEVELIESVKTGGEKCVIKIIF